MTDAASEDALAFSRAIEASLAAASLTTDDATHNDDAAVAQALQESFAAEESAADVTDSDDAAMARALQESFTAEDSAAVMLHDSDDAAMARALELRLQQNERDEELARRLDDEEMARRLAAQLNDGGGGGGSPPNPSATDGDAELARRMQAESFQAEQQHDASIALAMSLGGGAAAASEHGIAAARRLLCAERDGTRQQREQQGELLRQHLFSGGSAAAPAACPPRPTAPAAPVVSSCSYAMVVGDGEHQPSSSSSGPSPTQLRSNGGFAPMLPTYRSLVAPPPPRPRALRPAVGPSLIIDGANVACGYGRGGRFDAEGIRLCVSYFMQRGAGGGRRLSRDQLAVTLNENRYDANDAVLLGLADLISWTPVAKDDDVFLIQCACDHNA